VSSLLVMAILGGAILTPVQRWNADVTKNLQISLMVPLVACACVAFHVALGHRIERKHSKARIL
jgi:FHS family L-fucose permease-like MFS transporter